MLIIIIPVIILTLWFAWHYRQSNKAAKYDPEWHHSTGLEVVIWSAPLAIIGSGEPVSAAVSALGEADALLVHVDGKPAGVLTRQDLLGYLTAG